MHYFSMESKCFSTSDFGSWFYIAASKNSDKNSINCTRSYTTFLKKFWWIYVLFWGHWYPCFGLLVTSPLGFKARVGSALFAFFCGGKCSEHSSRSTSGATHADLLAAGVQPVTFPHACEEVGLGLDSNGQSPRQKRNALPLCQRRGLLLLHYLVYPSISISNEYWLVVVLARNPRI